MEARKFVGKHFPWLDALPKVTGEARYVADIDLSGMVYGKLLRSPLAHARVLNVDLSGARRVPGVKAVVAAEDAPDIKFGNSGNLVKDRKLFARDKVRHLGEPIVAVAAIDEDIAAEALSLIKVEYQPLPAIFEPEKAVRPEAPLIHEEIEKYEAVPNLIKYGNVCSFSAVHHGELDPAFRESYLVCKDDFRTPMIHQGYMETLACIASVDQSGRVVLWTSTQCPFGMQALLAQVLCIPLARVRVICPPIGGAFGGKNTMDIAPYAALLALKARRPVRIVLGRDEEFLGTGARHPAAIELRTGVARDGTFLASEACMVFDTGAYADFGPAVSSQAVQQMFGPYNIPNLRFEARAVYTNKPSGGCCRSHGSAQPTFAFESQIDLIAQRLGIDPLELRMKNLIKKGEPDSLGRPMNNDSQSQIVQRAGEWIKEKRKRLKPNRGLGMALGMWHSGGRSSSTVVKLNEDASLTVLTGAGEVTGTSAALAQIAAEELGVGIDSIHLPPVDTDLSPFDVGSSGSRIVYNVGNALRQALASIKKKLFELASERLEANPADLEVRNGAVCVKGSPEKSISMQDLSRFSCRRKGGPIIAAGSHLEEPMPYDSSRTKGLVAMSARNRAFVAQAAEVEVDLDTGQVQVIEIASFHDIGVTINPMGAEGQAEGGALQGLGFALMEEMVFQQGKPLNPKLKDYHIPKAVDAPPVTAFFIEDGAGPGPFGAKGLGELPVIPTAAAIANAIDDAAKIRVRELPLCAEKVWKAQAKQRGSY